MGNKLVFLDANILLDIIEKEFFKVIQNRWLIFPFVKEVIKSGIELSIEKNLDLEDILQCLCAKENGCSYLITNDKKFYDCGIKIMTTKEFLESQA